MLDLEVPDLEVIDEPATALAVLDPVRARVLANLVEPGSATTVANAIDEPRQKVNYHLRTLEGLGLLRLVEERPRRGLTERILVASARSYVLSPSVLGESAADPARTDRLSTRYLVALGARMVREVAELARGAEQANKPLATLAIDTEIRFASAEDRARFTEELTNAITSIAGRYHNESASGGRWHRLVVAAHQRPITKSTRPVEV
ncbi:MAG: helix-turn-helix domain-containing protein [Acidimicrobiales bacterium]